MERIVAGRRARVIVVRSVGSRMHVPGKHADMAEDRAEREQQEHHGVPANADAHAIDRTVAITPGRCQRAAAVRPSGNGCQWMPATLARIAARCTRLPMTCA